MKTYGIFVTATDRHLGDVQAEDTNEAIEKAKKELDLTGVGDTESLTVREKVDQSQDKAPTETNTFPIHARTAAQIESVFTYQKPANEEIAARLQEVRDRFKAMASFVASKVPESRELSIAMTHLELASMEAIAGIVRNQG